MYKKNLFITTLSIIVGLLLIFPIYFLFLGSFRPENNVFDTSLFLLHFNFSNYTEALDTGILRSILNSLIVSVTVTIVAMLFHAMAGYSLARFDFPGKKQIFSLIISSLMVPFTIIMIPLYMVTKNLGMANSYMGLIVPMLFNAYGIFLFRQFYLNFPDELEEAAYIEGSSFAGTFFKIALPLSKPVILPLTIGFFTANWNNYLWPLIINQKEELWVVQVALAHIVGGGYETPWNVVLAAAVLGAVPTFLLFFSLQRFFVEGIKMSGIK